jgi:excisionase family DNA binding protein
MRLKEKAPGETKDAAAQPSQAACPAPARSLACSREEAAMLLQISKRTVSALIAQGSLRVKRIGRRVLIPRRELEKFMRGGDVAIRPAKGKRESKTEHAA